MSKELTFAQAQRFVRQASDGVVEALPGETLDFYKGAALGHIACALADTEGMYVAHGYATAMADRLDFSPEASLETWAVLYEKGDAAALPQARRAAGLPTEDADLNKPRIVHPLHDAPRFVRLVRAGDLQCVELARDSTAKHAIAVDRVPLLGDLYCAGDDLSLPIALHEAQKSRADSPAMSGRIDLALFRMAQAAAKRRAFRSAHLLVNNMQANDRALDMHAQLFEAGCEASLPEVLRLMQLPEARSSYSLQRSLAIGGYEPAVGAIRKRLKKDHSPLV